MNARWNTHALFLLAVVVLAGLTWATLTPTDPAQGAPGSPRRIDVVVPIDPDEPEEVVRPVFAAAGPQQEVPGLARLFSENFEEASFPPVNSKWSIADRCAVFPGTRGDIVAWGRTTCDASNGSASLWAVGGGQVGRTYPCGATYPATIADVRRTCEDVNTLLRYTTFDMVGAACLRVTFDYKAHMPPGSLKLQLGERDDQANIRFFAAYENFEANTAGEWVRGVIRNFAEAAGKGRLVLGFFYIDETKTGGYTGAFIDNIHVDVLQTSCNVPPKPSEATPTEYHTPTPPEETDTPEPGLTPPTVTPGRVTPTRTPKPTRKWIFMPLVSNRFDVSVARPPYHTAPPPTRTPLPSLTPTPSSTPTETSPPTRTLRPTRTPPPSRTPTNTPRPSPTPVPTAEVIILEIIQMPPPGSPQQLETLTLKNIGTAEQLMDDWRVFNLSHNRSCWIPEGVIIPPDGTYEIRSGRDAVTDATGFACDSGYIWDNHVDEAHLLTEWNVMVACWAYNEDGPYNCMPTDLFARPVAALRPGLSLR